MLLFIIQWGQACISLLKPTSIINTAIYSISHSGSGKGYSLTGSVGVFLFLDRGNGTVMTITIQSTFYGAMTTLASFTALCD